MLRVMLSCSFFMSHLCFCCLTWEYFIKVERGKLFVFFLTDEQELCLFLALSFLHDILMWSNWDSGNVLKFARH